MAYTDIDDPTAYFQTALYTGNAGTNNITFDGNSDMQPNLIWIKERGGTGSHIWVDTVRGISASSTPFIKSNSSGAQVTNNTNAFVTSSNSDGFSLGADSYFTDVNKNNSTYASWNWKAGTSFTNDASSTGIGSIDSAGSFNNTSGFSIVSWSGTGSTATLKHGLSTAPSMIITKSLGGSSAWGVYNESLGNTKIVFLNESGANGTNAAYWNNTSPTSSVFTVGSDAAVNHSGNNMIAYCFAEKKGYSKFGQYTGSSSQIFNYTGFKPRFILIKKTSETASWQLFDTKRTSSNGGNVLNYIIYPNLNNSEDNDAYNYIDSNSNGFRCFSGPGGQGTETNKDGQNFIYMAFAENPFVTSTGNGSIPATAR